MKGVVIGGVISTQLTIERLAAHGFEDVHVWGFSPEDTSLVSGWVPLEDIAAKFGYAFTPFIRIADHIEQIQACQPDVLMAVGLSQILPAEFLNTLSALKIGFHPTQLPEGRGRAAIAWLVLDQQDGAASLFELGHGVDDGPILAQVPFAVTAQDDAASVYEKLLAALGKALDELLPEISAGSVQSIAQDHSQATWFGGRRPNDGLIDWTAPRADILRLIRASAPPHPGAFTFFERCRIVIDAANLDDTAHRGVAGRISEIDPGNSGFSLSCADGLLKVTHWKSDSAWQPRIGMRLGYYSQIEINKLLRHTEDLEQRLQRLEHVLARSDLGE